MNVDAHGRGFRSGRDALWSHKNLLIWVVFYQVSILLFRDLLNGIRHIKKTIHTTWFSKPNFSMQATQTQMSAQDTAFADMHICQTNDSSSLVAGSTSPLHSGRLSVGGLNLWIYASLFFCFAGIGFWLPSYYRHLKNIILFYVAFKTKKL